MSALANHTITLYAAMEKAAKVNEHQELVFEGNYTNLSDSLGIPRAYYTRIRAFLSKLGCIEVLSRGAGGRGSCIMLLRAPREEDFTNSTLTERREAAILVKELETRVAALEAWRLSQTGGGSFNIAEALRNHEQRISHLERE